MLWLKYPDGAKGDPSCLNRACNTDRNTDRNALRKFLCVEMSPISSAIILEGV
jgi:hypothetical protein